MTPELEQQVAQAQAMIKAVYEDGVATINGRDYQFTTAQHAQRRKVFAYYTKIGRELQNEDFSFLDSPEFEPVERTINRLVLFEGQALAKLPNHWDEYPEDYLRFIPTAMGVISYPFLKGNVTGSGSTSAGSEPTT